MKYLWENDEWPTFTWDLQRLQDSFSLAVHEQGRLLGKMESLGFDLQKEAQLTTRTADVIKSSEIEGEYLDYDQVRSSVARSLGLTVGGLVPSSQQIDSVVELTIDATERCDDRLDEKRLFKWHSTLFPNGTTRSSNIRVGCWRDDRNGSMQVASGPLGRENVHFQAVPAHRVAQEMNSFLRWFEAPGDLHPLLVAGLAHLRFLTIHPFDDGNGRIARALSDMVLARAENTRKRFYSVSSQISKERSDYYRKLEFTQKGTMDVTRWLEWFLRCVHRSLKESENILGRVLMKSRFWTRLAQESLNARQIEVLGKLLEGFEGKLTSSKWAKIAKCSQDTATRDINELVRRGALTKDPAGGRSTSYSLFSPK